MFIQGLIVVGSVVFDNAGTSNSSKQRHGWPPLMELGSAGSEQKKLA
jgi:hypothetical protein